MSTIAPIENEGTHTMTELSTTTDATTELDRPNTPENLGPPHHSVGDTPAKPHSTNSLSFRNGTLEEKCLAIIDNLGYTIPELDMGFFVNMFLPPLKDGINVTDVISSLEGEGLINSDGMWEKFWHDLIRNPSKKYAVEMSWPLVRRISEAEILDKAKRELEALDGNPDHRKQHSDRNLVDCLPKLFLHEDLGDLLKEGSFRSRTMHTKFLSENRVWCVLAFEYLIPLFALKNLDDFKQAVRDMVQGHHFLFISPSRTLHRDISIGNLMVRIDKGGIHGVLNDWDLAEVGEPAPDGHSETRMGTRPFMARELFVPEPAAHMERFDWESFYYVLIWIGCYYAEGKVIQTLILLHWNSPDDRLLRSVKRDLVTGPVDSLVSNFTDFYKPLALDWVVPLQDLFREGCNACDVVTRLKLTGKTGDVEAEFDMETLGGNVTYDKIWEVLQK